jgi:hypothetical protein
MFLSSSDGIRLLKDFTDQKRRRVALVLSFDELCGELQARILSPRW